MRPTVEQVGSPALRPSARGLEPVEHGHEGGRAIAHGAVDHLTLAGLARLDHPGQYAEGQVKGTAAEVAHQIERWDGLVFSTDGVERPGDCDVVHVVSGCLGIGPELAPARHPAIDQFRITLQGQVGTEAKPLHDSGAEALEHDVCGLEQLEAGLDGSGVLQVQTYGAPAPGGDVRGTAPPLALAVDPHHVCAKVRQEHAAEGSGPDAREFNDLEAGQGSLAHICLPWIMIQTCPG